MSNRKEIQEKLNNEHFDNPEPGDYWNEMFCPYFVVLECLPENKFVICHTRQPIDSHTWTWDLSKTQIVSKEYFNVVKYRSIPGFVANVIPEHHWAVEEYFKEWKSKFPPLDSSLDNELLEVVSIKEEYNGKQNRIVCAANRHRDTGEIVLGVRHHDKLMNDIISRLNLSKNWEQGFIDRNYEFRTREEALIIAKKANQIIRRCGGDERELFSENLY